AAEALVAEAESRKQAADAAAKQAVAGQQAAESARQQAEQDKQTAQKAERDANDARKQAVMLADAANLARKSADEAAATAMLNQRKAVQELTKANEEKQRVIAESEAITKQARADVAAAEAEVRSQQSLADRVALDSLIQQLEAQQDLREWQALIPLATKALQELEERAAAGRPNPWFTDAVRNSIREKLQQATRQANAPASSARLEFPERTTLAALSDDGRTLVRILRQADQPTAPRHLEFLNPAAPNAPDKATQRLPFNEQSSVDRLLVSKHGAHVAVLLKTGMVLIFSRSQQQQFEQRAEVPLTIGGRPFRTAFLTFSGNEQRLYLAASDRRTSLQILDLTAAQTQPLLQETALFADPVVDHRCTHFAVSPDERFLLHYSAEGRDRFIRAFPMVTGTTTGSLQPDTRPEAVTRMNIGQLRIRQPAGDGAGQFLPETLLTLSLTPDGSALILGLNSRSDRRAWAWLPRDTAANETEFPFAVGRDDALLEAFASADDQLPAFLKVSLDGRRIVAGHLRRRDNLEVWTVQNGRIQPAGEFQLHQYQGGGRVSAIVSGQSEAVVDAAFTDGAAGLLTSVDSRAVTHWNLPGYGDFVRERQQLVDEFRRLKTPAAAPPAKGNAGRRLPAAGIATPVSLPFEDSEVSPPSVLQDEFRPKFLQRWTSVYSLQFNPVNGRLLVGADDLAAHLLDRNGKPVLSVSSRPDPLREQLTAGSGTESGGYLTEGHNSNIVATRFLPDGSLLTAENLGVICVWDAQPDADGMGQEKCRLLTGSGGGGFAVSPDGRFVVAGGAELQDRAKPDSGLSARVLVWQSSDFDKSAAPAAFRQLQVEAGSADTEASAVQISSVAVSPAGTLVAAGCRNGQILLWSLQDSTLLDLQRSHREDQITAVCFLNDSTLLTAGYDGTVRSWTIENGRLAAAAILVRGSQILSLEATADGRRFAIIDLQPDAPRRDESATAENSEGTSALQSEGEQIVGARLRISLHNSNGQLQLLLQDRLLADTESVLPLQTGLSWSSDGERLLLLQSGRLTLFGGPQWQPLQAMQVASEQRIPVRAAIRGGAGQPLQVATVGGREAILWDLQTGRALTQFRSHSSGRLTASLSSDQNVVLTVSDALRAFDVREGSGTRGRTLLRVASTDLHQTPLSDARFSPAHGDLRFLSCDQAGELGLWQYRDGVLPQLLQRIPAGEQSVPTWAADSGIVNFVSQVAWRPDGQVFAGLQRGVLHCWSIGLQQSTVAGTDPLTAITLPLPAGLD
ncbi:MAG TPA: hypothetical protein DIT89_13440, partial [Planctomycetaceae bacterium]|nr:hypothetical protein [Planctomycetaceae bacterium]